MRISRQIGEFRKNIKKFDDEAINDILLTIEELVNAMEENMEVKEDIINAFMRRYENER